MNNNNDECLSICANCKNHGIRVSAKSHKYVCAYKDCRCQLCTATKTMRNVMAMRVYDLK
ncbi:doublesex- and mab-3-related transcription factor C2-like protein [Dinothrombium tinctorium]|uniref:Doublesex-and mab-3-related transcription factor C2-like protein n=1 Tax=Dinothrombium tinctorium TaxID=1965070 RepID=A0A3S3NXE8_9ACAR|nr:doublesex- and mab-3-related transcription factor C2-like protein [Dinothrombium tinctorium]RWS03762.1 doublesex- and mab-3-related transcription factor C2-like protein [Dinothrombium tinctorium]